MKLRNLLILLAVTLSSFTFSSCSEDESENIVPTPLNTDEVPATVGNEGDDAGGME